MTPVRLRATLRPYQVAGVRWLVGLARAGDAVGVASGAAGGILADDMGLGKGVQALAALLAMRAATGRPLAALIVAPTSVAGNWVGEVAKHAPGLPVALWAGPDRHAPCHLRRVAAAELVVTSYDLLRRDLALFQRLRLTHLVLDEAQALKTPTSATHAAVRSLAAGYKLAVTGTPVENRLADLWSLLAIVAPGLLPDRRLFTRRYATPIANGDLKARAELCALVAPRLLRRTKQEVASDLPPKTIIDRRVPLTGVALTTYRRVAAEVRAAVRAAPDDHALVLAGLTRLRLAATDPRLVAPGAGQDRDAPKLVALHDVLGAARANDARVLVFSAFARALDLVGRALATWGVRFLRLDGSTPERDRRALVTRFQQDPRLGAFLISLKAGGTGLTLTGASVVVLYDPWWNPMAEAQAIDRTHRIGQAVPVTAYRLVAAGTVEDKVRRLQGQKRALARAVLGDGATGASARARADAAEARAVLAALLAADGASGGDGL